MLPVKKLSYSASVILLVSAAGILALLDRTRTWGDFGILVPPGHGLLSDVSPTPFHGVKGWFLALSFTYYLLVLRMGYWMSRWCLGLIRAPFAIQVMAGFAPGYLGAVAINRVLTLFVSRSVVIPAIFATIAGVSVFLEYLWEPYGPRNWQSKWTQGLGRSLREVFGAKELAVAAGLVLALLFFLGYGVQVGPHFMAGDATGFTLRNVILNPEVMDRAWPSLPLIGEHYDELAFNFPLILWKQSGIDPVLSFWFLTAFGKVAIFSLLVVLFLRFRTPVNLAYGASFFLTLGSGGLNPANYLLKFDSGNPLGMNLHFGRALGAIIPLYLVRVFQIAQTPGPGAPRYAAWGRVVSIVLVCAGISATSVHNLIYCLIALIVTLFVSPAPSRARTIGITLAMIAPLLEFAGGSGALGSVRGWGVGLGLAAAIISLGISAYRNQEIDWKKTGPRTYLICLATLFITSLGLGNVFTAWMAGVFDVTLISRYSQALGEGMSWFSSRGCTGVSVHCLGLNQFFAYYGLVVIAGLIAMRTLKSRVDQNLLLAFAGCWCFGFLVFDFSYIGLDPWFTTRLLETPYYSILILFFCGVGVGWSRRSVDLLAAATLLWTVLPLLVNRRFEQVWLGLEYIFRSY